MVLDTIVNERSHANVLKEIGQALIIPTGGGPVQIKVQKTFDMHSKDTLSYTINVVLNPNNQADVLTGNLGKKRKLESSIDEPFSYNNNNNNNNNNNIIINDNDNDNDNSNINNLHVAQHAGFEESINRLKTALASPSTDDTVSKVFIEKLHQLGMDEAFYILNPMFEKYLVQLSGSQTREAMTAVVEISEFLFHQLYTKSPEKRAQTMAVLYELSKTRLFTEGDRQVLSNLKENVNNELKSPIAYAIISKQAWLWAYSTALHKAYPLGTRLASFDGLDQLDLNLIKISLLKIYKLNLEGKAPISAQRVNTLINHVSKCIEDDLRNCNELSVKEVDEVLSQLELFCTTTVQIKIFYTVRRMYCHEDLSGMKERVRMIANMSKDQNLLQSEFTLEEIQKIQNYNMESADNPLYKYHDWNFLEMILRKAERLYLRPRDNLTEMEREILFSLISKAWSSIGEGITVECDEALKVLLMQPPVDRAAYISSLLDAMDQCNHGACRKLLATALAISVQSSTIPSNARDEADSIARLLRD